MAELSEKDFIQESYPKDPFPIWFWLFVVMCVSGLLMAANLWYNHKIKDIFQESPFLQVTNREISLFLWQNPEFMRANVSAKNGYLPAFQYIDRVGLDPDFADDYAIAPPEVIFRYHTWRRLLWDEFIPLPIPKDLFIKFIEDSAEWKPQYWSKAPQAYEKMLAGLPESPVHDLATLSDQQLPHEVRVAFQGWKHFFYDGKAINALKPTSALVTGFLEKHPHYARNDWRNILEERYPEYLLDLTPDQIPPFVKVALYEYSAIR